MHYGLHNGYNSSQVLNVYYAGLPEHPGHALAKKQQRAFGGVLSFTVR